MTSVEARNVKNIFFKAVFIFLSRVFIKKLDENQKILFRKVEKSLKCFSKLKADSKFVLYHYNMTVYVSFSYSRELLAVNSYFTFLE